MKHTYKIKGMSCNGCKTTIEKALNDLKEVEIATVDLENEEAVITMKNHISAQKLQVALTQKGNYSLQMVDENIQNDNWKSIDSSNLEEKSDFKSLFPLFLIFGYIIVASILLNIKPSFNLSGFMLDFMGLFYIVFSFFKFLDLKGFPDSFRMYDPLAKVFPIYGCVYPFIELLLGIMFLMSFYLEIALFTTLIILGVTTVGVIRILFNKKSIQCACLGTALKLPMTKATFIENTIMLVMAVWMLINLYN